MEFRGNAKIDQSRVRYAGGSGSRGGGRRGLAIGGGLGGTLIVLLVVFLGPSLGIDPAQVLQAGDGGPYPAPAGEVSNVPECRTGADIETKPECRWPAYVTAIEGFWQERVKGYRPAITELYSGGIRTACGAANSQMGPFYCPGDEKVYLDTEFMGLLLRQLGAKGGYAAEAYIVAHEYGHHVQHLLGTSQRAQQGAQSGPTSGSVRLELQADCYAGVWFHHAQRDPDSLIAAVSEDDLTAILDAARAVGDDHIQQQQLGRVVQEDWTHGSSQQRQQWLHTGFTTGDPNQCDTFGG